MNHIGIFEDLNYISEQEYRDMRHEHKLWMEFVKNTSLPCKPVEMEFMYYVTNGMKNFLKSPFHHGVQWEYKGDL